MVIKKKYPSFTKQTVLGVVKMEWSKEKVIKLLHSIWKWNFYEFCPFCFIFSTLSISAKPLEPLCTQSRLFSPFSVCLSIPNPRVQPGMKGDGITVKILICCQLKHWADHQVGSLLLIFLFLFLELEGLGTTRKQMKKVGWLCTDGNMADE